MERTWRLTCEDGTRDRLHVLLSIDVARMPAPRGRGFFATRVEDKDFPMAWVKRHGEGRVFFTAFGHYTEAFSDPRLLSHYLAGIQYALGDLATDDRPSDQVRR